MHLNRNGLREEAFSSVNCRQKPSRLIHLSVFVVVLSSGFNLFGLVIALVVSIGVPSSYLVVALAVVGRVTVVGLVTALLVVVLVVVLLLVPTAIAVLLLLPASIVVVPLPPEVDLAVVAVVVVVHVVAVAVLTVELTGVRVGLTTEHPRVVEPWEPVEGRSSLVFGF